MLTSVNLLPPWTKKHNKFRVVFKLRGESVCFYGECTCFYEDIFPKSTRVYGKVVLFHRRCLYFYEKVTRFYRETWFIRRRYVFLRRMGGPSQRSGVLECIRSSISSISPSLLGLALDLLKVEGLQEFGQVLTPSESTLVSIFEVVFRQRLGNILVLFIPGKQLYLLFILILLQTWRDHMQG